jgi:predicted nuclease of predicted toxin-antitoxin system
MTFFADESVDRQIVERLRDDGHEVLYVVELDPGILDEEVLARANEHKAVLITADKDFGELVFRQKRIHAGVILVSLSGASPSQKSLTVSSAVSQHSDAMIGAFSVVSLGFVRIRKAV